MNPELSEALKTIKQEVLNSLKADTLFLTEKQWLTHAEIRILYGKSRNKMTALRQTKGVKLRVSSFPGDKQILYWHDDIKQLLETRMI